MLTFIRTVKRGARKTLLQKVLRIKYFLSNSAAFNMKLAVYGIFLGLLSDFVPSVSCVVEGEYNIFFFFCQYISSLLDTLRAG